LGLRRRDEVTREWRRLEKEELYASYSPPNIIRVIKSRRMRWAVHVACEGEESFVQGILWRNLRERDHLEYLPMYVCE
jgi:hypothetical protein